MSVDADTLDGFVYAAAARRLMSVAMLIFIFRFFMLPP